VFDIGALEFVVLAVAALFIFGPDRLPDIARQAARGLRQVRNMAANARRELSRELGPEFEDLDIRDLNPRNFVRKHVLDDLDEDDLRIDRDLDIRDDLRVDDKPSRSKVNGSTNGAGTSTSRTSDADTATGSADKAEAEAEGTDTLVDTAPASDAGEPATVPPYDTEAT
jgi:sec-independent protein translocase protein TatB